MLRRGFFTSSAIWEMDVPPESEDESTAMPAPRGVHIRQPHAHIHGDGDHRHADHDAAERGEDIGLPFLQWRQQAAEGNSL